MTDEMRGVALWAVRMALLWLGGFLSARGIGDSDLWGGLVDNLAGVVVMAGTALWSYYARKAQLAAVPPEVKP